MNIHRRHRKPFVIPVLIFINLSIYICWSYLYVYLPKNFMPQNFLVSWNALEMKRYWVLITAAFSHNMLFHFLINMYVLYSFGSFIEIFLGRRRTLWIYLCAGFIGNLGHAFTSKYITHSPQLPALGASGAVAGIILLFSLLFPKEKILLFGIIPIPALLGALAFVGLDLWGLYFQSQGGGFPIGHGAHLGGAFTGLLFYLYLRLRYKRRS